MSDQLSPSNLKVNLYISYTSQDQVLLDELLKYLTALPWENITISSYHERQIAELTQTEEVESRINSADVVVMIVSSTYLDSVDRRRWELDEIAGKPIVIAINVSPVSLKASRLESFCSSCVDDSPVTSWSGQVEKLKIAAGSIYEAASTIARMEFMFSMMNVSVAMSTDFSEQGQQDSEKPNVAQLQQKLEQVYRLQEPPSSSTITNKDLVDCSVFSPPAVPCGEPFLVQVFVHLPEQAEIAKQQAQEFDQDTNRRGVKSLGLPIERGTVLTFSLSIPNLEVEEFNQDLVWNGRPESVTFEVNVPADLTQKTVIATITVSQNSIPLGHLKFKLSITPTAASTAKELQPSGDAARVYKKAFVSYSSKDRQEVLKRVQGLAVTGIEVFQDILNLEPGQRWEKELYRNIDECDLFLLFWSTAAKESKWVLKEALYALERQEKDGLNAPEIIPVIIEGPPAVSPPNELQHLHFNDKLLYLIAQSN